MKKAILLTSLLFTFLTMQAQTKWSISLSGKVVLKNRTEDPEKNILKIKRPGLKKPGNITISFAKKDTASVITIMADDANRSGLKSWENVSQKITITSAELKELYTGRSKIVFYYTAIPRDPEKAALVRMRPIHLFTVVLQ